MAPLDRAAEANGESLHPGGLDLTARAVGLCPLPPGARVLDAGCGLGASLRHLATLGFRPCGLDLTFAGLQQCGGSAAQAASERLPIATGAFAAVLAECMLSLVADPAQTLREFCRVLAPGGWLIMSDLYARRPEGLAALRPLGGCYAGLTTRPAIEAWLAAAGFRCHTWEDHSPALRTRVVFLPPVEAHGLEALDRQLLIAAARPGYYLTLAQTQAPAEAHF